MFIELFQDENGLITGFRHGWTQKAIAPILENTFNINPSDFNSLVDFLTGRPVKISPIQGVGDWASGSLGLLALDMATTEVFKSDNSGFFETAKGL